MAFASIYRLLAGQFDRIRAWLSTPAQLVAPHPLAARQPGLARPAALPAIWLILIVAAFVPRALMALKVDTICPDGVLYLRLADAIERGTLDVSPVDRLQIGVYPFALANIHRLGLEWETCVKVWGVLLSSLAVLPLFGWLRRQFGDRVAFVAGLIYAAHPKLIEHSPEAIRDPTFWFLFALSLYLLWRAEEEVDWRYFVAAGVAMPLCALTRFEGWFLFIPLLGWTGLRFYWLAVGRARLLGSASLCAATAPVVIVLFGWLLPADAGWSYLRVEPLERTATWLASWQTSNDVTAPTGSPSPLPPAIASTVDVASKSAPPPANASTLAAGPLTDTPAAIDPIELDRAWSLGRHLQLFTNTIERGLTPLFAICVFGGYFANLRRLNRGDTLPILLIILAIGGGIWIHLANAHVASSRYVLSITLLSASAAAMGVLGCAQFLATRRAQRWFTRPTFARAATALLIVIGIVGWADALSSDMRNRSALANLGRWLQSEYGTSRSLVGSESQLAVVGYYARGSSEAFPVGLADDALVGWIAYKAPDVMILSPRKQTPQEIRALIDRRVQLGFTLVDTSHIPDGPKNLIVLARPPRIENDLRHAAKPPAAASATP